MIEFPQNATYVTIKVTLKLGYEPDFADWQAKLNQALAKFPGFVSLEILSSKKALRSEWVIVQQFADCESVAAWQISPQYQQLKNELKPFLINESKGFLEVEYEDSELHGGVTEVFVTEVSPENENEYREWLAKIHRAEAKSPGFRGVYVQAPNQTENRKWISFLQFDTQKNLEGWLSSSERKALLEISTTLINSIESHRLASPYGGWFSSLKSREKQVSIWKQTMIVLLALFPLVMLELRFLSPLLAPLNNSLAIFISNTVSVTLLAWPLIPFCIKYLGWWLAPKKQNHLKTTILGTLFVGLLYILEISLFWSR